MPFAKPCLDCKRLTRNGSRCPDCKAVRERERPSRQVRGYDTRHTAARRSLLAQMPALCGYGCGTWLTKDTFVAAHRIDGNPDAGWLASCRSCNEKAKTTRHQEVLAWN